jgi:Zn-dependent protease
MNRLNAFLNWSVRVGQLFGIPINLHISLAFFLLPLLARQTFGFARTLEYVVLVVLSILLHELGHALTAKRYHLTGLSIMLHGFGGFAIARGTRTPKQALVISLAGPAVTFVIAGLCLAIGSAGMSSASFGSEASIQFYLIHFLGSLNLIMGILNLMPSFPFDGGNSLRAILSMRIPEFKASRAVGHIGLIFTPLLGIYALITDQQFIFIFALMGLIGSLMTLMNSGGVRFGEFFADRRARKEAEAMKARDVARSQAYLSDVNNRLKEREERERLRKILEASLDD